MADIMFEHSKIPGVYGVTPSKGPNRTPPFGGFTFLELLVAMALVSLVTLIGSMAFRLTIQAWERGAEEGESRQIESTLPVLLEKQFDSRVISRLFDKAMVNPDNYFCGTENSLSFLTSYAPQGSLLQGVLQVRYQFDPGQETLLIYMKSVTRLDDLAENAPGLRSTSNDEGIPVSQIHGIKNFRLLYTYEPQFDVADVRQWQNDWRCDTESRPTITGLMLEMTIGEGSRARSFRWYYNLGGQQSSARVGLR